MSLRRCDRAIAPPSPPLAIAFGSDTIFPHEPNGVRADGAPRPVADGRHQAATANAARVLGIEKEAGTLEIASGRTWWRCPGSLAVTALESVSLS